jgi:hypothetical protein
MLSAMNMRIKIAEMEKKDCVGFIIIFLGTWYGHYGSLLYIYIYIYIGEGCFQSAITLLAEKL